MIPALVKMQFKYSIIDFSVLGALGALGAHSSLDEMPGSENQCDQTRICGGWQYKAGSSARAGGGRRGRRRRRGVGNSPAFLSWVQKQPTARLSVLKENARLSIQEVGPAQTLKATEEPVWDLGPGRS